MAAARQRAEQSLREITECLICKNTFTDPRMLPCIHIFCFECLKRSTEERQVKPGDKMPCPFCRKEFVIPADGMTGVQKHFFMENSGVQPETSQQNESAANIHCYQCKVTNYGRTTSKATEICVECKEIYCSTCSRSHQILNRNHHLLKIRSKIKDEIRRHPVVEFCTRHSEQLLNHYCADCRIFTCARCRSASHNGHTCEYVTTVGEMYRLKIESHMWKISNYTEEIMLTRQDMVTEKLDFLKKLTKMENTIISERSHKLKARPMIDKHAESLLHELSLIKTKRLQDVEDGLLEIDRSCTILTTFKAYLTEQATKGPDSNIASSIAQLTARADDLERECAALSRLPYLPFQISFQPADLSGVLHKSNCNMVGKIQAKFSNCAVVVGLNDASDVFSEYPNDESIMLNGVIKVNIGDFHHPVDLSTQNPVPTKMTHEAFAAIYRNTIMYVTGLGINRDEIWKYNMASGWMECASLVEGRRGHSAAFVGEVLYICGGLVLSDGRVLDSVEAYNVVTDKCSTVGKLAHAVYSSGNCVPHGSSLYIFGGIDKFGCTYEGCDEQEGENDNVNHVQVYNTKLNTCSLLSKPMPRQQRLMRSVLWKTSAILIGCCTCYIFNFETETWQERETFKTDVHHFGLILDNERIFVFGGGHESYFHRDGETWKCRDDVRYVPLRNIIENKPIEWKIHGKLPQQSLIHAYGKMSC